MTSCTLITSSPNVFEIQYQPLLWIMSWDLDKWTRVFIQFAIRVSGLKCLRLSVNKNDWWWHTRPQCARLFTAFFVSLLQQNPCVYLISYKQILTVSSNIKLDNDQQLNSHSSAQYMNRWLSISKLASWHLFIVMIHNYHSPLLDTHFHIIISTCQYAWCMNTNMSQSSYSQSAHGLVCGYIALLFLRLFICLLYALAPFTFNIWRCHSHIRTL